MPLAKCTEKRFRTAIAKSAIVKNRHREI